MYVSQSVMDFLGKHGVDFDVVTHPRTLFSRETARCAGIPKRALAKGVLLTVHDDLLLSVVPASKRVDPEAVTAVVHAGPVFLVEEEDFPFVFRDCALGAIPATGPAFGLPTLVDDELLACPDVYFEGGDHEHLVHMRGGEFARLLIGQPHGPISC